MRRVATGLRNGERAVLWNSAWLVANTALGSALGVVFWIVAARGLTPAEVGLGAAAVSAIAAIGMASDLGLDTLLIRDLARSGPRQASLVNTALTVVVATTAFASLVFLAGAPIWSPGPRQSWANAGLFVIAATLLAAGRLFDRVFVACERAQLAFARNLVSNVARALAMIAIAGWFGAGGIVGAFAIGALLSTVPALVWARRTMPGFRPRPAFAWPLLRGNVGYALGNHAASLLWNLPGVVYPLVVVRLLGAESNARFYLTWMIANLLFVVPSSVSTAAFARASVAGCLDGRWHRRVLGRTLATLLVPALGLAALGPWALGIFGGAYQNTGHALPALLALSSLPYAANMAAIAWHRARGGAAPVVWVSGTASALCLASSLLLGARFGLTGIGAGWLAGQTAGMAVAWFSVRCVPRPSAGALLPRRFQRSTAP